MKTKLSPFVYQVKGKKNYLFLDSLQGEIFNISPEGDPYELEAQLIKLGLVFETEGVVPIKFKPNIEDYTKKVILRELQIRLSENCFFDCAGCGNTGNCKKGPGIMTESIFANLMDQFRNIPIQTLTIIGGNPLLEMDRLKTIISGIKADSYRIMCTSPNINELKSEIRELEKTGVSLLNSVCNTTPIDESSMSGNVSQFFYNQQFNPCWGNKIAVDSNGDIKPCMWSSQELGNIAETLIYQLIMTNKVDRFWLLNKDKIETCKECEYRYSCFDCRVLLERDHRSLTGKPAICSYNPGKGKW